MFGWLNKSLPRRMADMSAAFDGGGMHTRGLVSGTRVATVMGWRPVEALAPGDLMLTFDAGLQKLIEVRRETFWVKDMMTSDALAAIFVPSGALGNSEDLELLPDQGVLIESDAAWDANGDPFAVIPAKSLVGIRGISRFSAREKIEVVTLAFADEQVIYAEGDVLLHCPLHIMTLDQLGREDASYDIVRARDAGPLIASMLVGDSMVA